ncbi:UNVERIFIED_CONTAM: hypothetical protein K2H54_058942 [Gekko kuhli]
MAHNTGLLNVSCSSSHNGTKPLLLEVRNEGRLIAEITKDGEGDYWCVKITHSTLHARWVAPSSGQQRTGDPWRSRLPQKAIRFALGNVEQFRGATRENFVGLCRGWLASVKNLHQEKVAPKNITASDTEAISTCIESHPSVTREMPIQSALLVETGREDNPDAVVLKCLLINLLPWLCCKDLLTGTDVAAIPCPQ